MEKAVGPSNAEQQRKSYRTPQQRDRDRILYSSALQRLGAVTQITAPESGYSFHNRLSHSLKVAQVGRRNAERLQKLADMEEIKGPAADLVRSVDPDAVEASCLAHDLGHPPFGHIAEAVLHEKASEHVADGFEGNAQSFRIVTQLAVRDTRKGWPREVKTKLPQRSLGAEIMDWADDLTYAVHDVDDFFRAGLCSSGQVARAP